MRCQSAATNIRRGRTRIHNNNKKTHHLDSSVMVTNKVQRYRNVSASRANAFSWNVQREKWIKTETHKKCNNITKLRTKHIHTVWFKIIWKWIECVFFPVLVYLVFPFCLESTIFFFYIVSFRFGSLWLLKRCLVCSNFHSALFFALKGWYAIMVLVPNLVAISVVCIHKSRHLLLAAWISFAAGIGFVFQICLSYFFFSLYSSPDSFVSFERDWCSRKLTWKTILIQKKPFTKHNTQTHTENGMEKANRLKYRARYYLDGTHNPHSTPYLKRMKVDREHRNQRN